MAFTEIGPAMQIKRRKQPEIQPELNIKHPVIKAIYASRGIQTNEELNIKINQLLPFESLKDIDKAVERLTHALSLQEHIMIVGDFDADGATSTALAVSALKMFGAKHVTYLVPNRFEFGYGLTPGIVELASQSKPDLIITVDNGIASFDGVQSARDAGIDVLITDHHIAGDEIPKAVAVVNPNQPDDQFPSKSIAGVGVIFYVMVALRRALSEGGWFDAMNIPEPKMTQFLDLVALGTVADVVSLDRNNRIMVAQGLARIKAQHCRAGIKALVKVANRQLTKLRESDLGFSVAPRLNAAGRLDDMSLGIECLLEQNEDKALSLAKHLDDLNVERRRIEHEMKSQAFEALDKLHLPTESLPIALSLYDSKWHQGVIGILAGRLKEKFYRPVIAFARVSDEELKGSARSINGLNIRDVLASMNKDDPSLILKFGGHAMAAGLSIHPDRFEAFKSSLISHVEQEISLSDCRGEILTDGPLANSDLTIDFAELINQSGPWGQHFPEPIFDDEFEIIEQRLVGERHLKLTLALDDGGNMIDAIAFNVDTQYWPNHRISRIHAAYRLDINEYANRVKLQLIIEGLNPLKTEVEQNALTFEDSILF